MLWQHISQWLTRTPSATLSDEDGRLTYSGLLAAAHKHGAVLQAALPEKAKCAIDCVKNRNAAIAFLACWSAGMVPIPLSRQYGKRHCDNIIRTMEPDLVITDAPPEDSRALMEYHLMTGKLKEGPGGLSDPELRDVGVILCTSGTTGDPKGTMLREEGLLQTIRHIADYYVLEPTDKILIARPLYHCSVLIGEFLVALCNGISIQFFDGAYNPISLAGSIERHSITVLGGTPTLCSQMASYVKLKGLSISLRRMTVSGECLSEQAARNIRDAFPKTAIYNVYGLTEAGPRVSWLPPELFDQCPGSVGIPLNATVVKVLDSAGTGREAAAGETGLIAVQSPSLMKGYYRKPELTRQVLRDGWLLTGDIGYIDPQGLLYVCSRADDLIIVGGMNIYPVEIENAIKSLPYIEAVVAYGIRGETGEAIAVDVVIADGFPGRSKRSIMRDFAGLLPGYQLPAYLNIVPALSRNATGKIVRPSHKGLSL